MLDVVLKRGLDNIVDILSPLLRGLRESMIEWIG
jgi:hypothetical protein